MLARQITRELTTHGKYGVVIDPMGDWLELNRYGWAHQVITNQTPKNIDYAGYIRTVKRVVFEPVRIMQEDLTGWVNRVARAISEIENTVFVMDEGRITMPRQDPPEEACLLYTQGRHGAIDVITISQRVVDIALPAVTQANILISFGLQYPADRDMMARYMGLNPDIYESLKLHEFMVVDTLTGSTRKYPTSWVNL